MDNQIKTENQLKVVLNAIEEYYRFNACTTKMHCNDTYLSVSQLLLGATELATIKLQEEKEKESNFVDAQIDGLVEVQEEQLRTLLKEGDKVKLKSLEESNTILTYICDVDEELSRVQYANGDQLDWNKSDLERVV